MDTDLVIPRKWALRANGTKMVFVKHMDERSIHVVMKALLWALYLPTYPDLGVEVPVGDRYRPDVVALDLRGDPQFWGEAGSLSKRELHDLAKRYRGTHFAFARWGEELDEVVVKVQKSLRKVRRAAPCDVIVFPTDSLDRFTGVDGVIHVTHNDLAWMRLG